MNDSTKQVENPDSAKTPEAVTKQPEKGVLPIEVGNQQKALDQSKNSPVANPAEVEKPDEKGIQPKNTDGSEKTFREKARDCLVTILKSVAIRVISKVVLISILVALGLPQN